MWDGSFSSLANAYEDDPSLAVRDMIEFVMSPAGEAALGLHHDWNQALPIMLHSMHGAGTTKSVFEKVRGKFNRAVKNSHYYKTFKSPRATRDCYVEVGHAPQEIQARVSPAMSSSKNGDKVEEMPVTEIESKASGTSNQHSEATPEGEAPPSATLPAKQKRVLVPIANGSCEYQAMSIVTCLGKCGIEVKLASVDGDEGCHVHMIFSTVCL